MAFGHCVYGGIEVATAALICPKISNKHIHRMNTTIADNFLTLTCSHFPLLGY